MVILTRARHTAEWGTWSMGGISQIKVHADTATKVWGYTWASASGRNSFQSGRRRYELRVVARTGPMQLGVIGEQLRGRASWFSDACVGASFYVNGAGDVCTGRRKVGWRGFDGGRSRARSNVPGHDNARSNAPPHLCTALPSCSCVRWPREAPRARCWQRAASSRRGT